MQKSSAFFALPQTVETKTAFGIGRGEWRGFMYLQWNRIPKIYEKSVDAYGIKSRCFAGFASRNLRTTRHRARCLSGSEFSANGVSINVRKLSIKTQVVCDYAIGSTLVHKNMAAILCNA